MKQNFCLNAIRTFILIYKTQVNGRRYLAEELGVSERSISTYIVYLKEELNVEIIWDTKAKKYVVEDEGIFKEFISNTQLKSMDIWLILIIVLRTQFLLPTKVKILQSELLRFVGNKERMEMENLFSFEKVDDERERYHEYILEKIYTSFIDKKKINIRYMTSNEETDSYELEPQNITFNHGKIYLLGLNKNKKLRTFRIDRIKDIVILEELKEESDFSLTDYLSKSWNMFGGDETRIVVKFNKKAAKIVKEKLGVSKKILDEGDNYITYEFIALGIEGICIDLLGFKGDFEVIEPIELREQIYNIGKMIVENNKF